ncbi:MAG TPA: hypothetical protein VGN14_04150 [Candidatus Elarobacter sp.]
MAGAGAQSAAAAELLRAELDGVRVLARGDAAEALRDADMLLFVAGDDEPVDAERTAMLAGAARNDGILVAALIVTSGRAHGASPLLAVIRDAADTVLVVRDAADARAVVAALR